MLSYGWSALMSAPAYNGAAGVNYTAAGAAAHGVLTAPNSWTIRICEYTNQNRGLNSKTSSLSL
jgi:hypothetical protein